MQEKDVLQQVEGLKKALEESSASLRILSLVKLAEEFYTKEEREEFYGRWQVMDEYAEKVRQKINSHRSDDPRSWEKFAEEESRETVAAARAEIQANMQEAKEWREKIQAHEQQHPVLASLIHMRRRAAPSL